jgi:hypothetical protein
MTLLIHQYRSGKQERSNQRLYVKGEDLPPFLRGITLERKLQAETGKC